MKDFDVERLEQAREPVQFTVGGETLTVRPFVKPEVLIDFHKSTPTGMEGVLDEWDKFISAMIVPEDVEKWQKVREQADPPLSLGNIENIGFWLLEATTGRPIKASSPSRRGRVPQAAT